MRYQRELSVGQATSDHETRAVSATPSSKRIRILVHDFAGHPFQIQLSRELSRRGHSVTHAFAGGLPGPKGKLNSERVKCGLTIECVPLSSQFQKYSPVRRLITHRGYAKSLKRLVSEQKPDVVLSGNTPVDVQLELLAHCHGQGTAFVHWVQDVYFRAMEFVLRPKLGKLASAVILPFRSMEERVVRRSDSIVTISSDFRSILADWGAQEPGVVVIENWAPLDEITPLPRCNDWSRSLGFNDQPTLIYSGTLGLKHRPDLLYKLAEALNGQARVIVISEGPGRDYLDRMPPLPGLTLLGFQPYERLSEVLASADVLLATLEADAGEFAIPSKVLSYMSAGRTILLAAPKKNLAASIVRRSGAGLVTDPEDVSGWLAAGTQLVNNGDLRSRCAVAARTYAEREFDIEAIAERFERVLVAAIDTAQQRFSKRLH